jgi:hypothetical protein
MIQLKEDLIANDNMWEVLITKAYGRNTPNVEDIEETQSLVTEQANGFIITFDRVCKKYLTKKVANSGQKKGLSQKLKVLVKVAKWYSAKYNKIWDKGLELKELDIV